MDCDKHEAEGEKENLLQDDLIKFYSPTKSPNLSPVTGICCMPPNQKCLGLEEKLFSRGFVEFVGIHPLGPGQVPVISVYQFSDVLLQNISSNCEFEIIKILDIFMRYVSVCSFRLMCCHLLFCFSGVLVLTFFVNRFHVNTVTSKDQFIIAYGGLRGAICFSLVFLLPDFHRKKLFIAATTVVILFTVFVQVKMLSPKE